MDFWNMAFWNVVCLVVIFGLALVFPAISLVVSVRGLGSDALNEKQRRAGEQELRKAGIVRAGEEWEEHDLDKLMLNMRRYDQWKSIGVAATILLTGGVGDIALVVIARGSILSSAYAWPAIGFFLGATTLGVSVGYIMSDRRFMTREGTLPAPPADAIFTGADGVFRSPWWLRVIDSGLIVSVIICTLLYAVGMGGPLEDPSARLSVARYPWVIWCIPLALCVIVAAQEFLVRWEIGRPPLRLTGQPELAERADLHRRREACKGVYDLDAFPPIPWLSLNQLMAFSSSALSSLEFPMMLAAFGVLFVSVCVYGLADTRRKRQARRAAGAGIRGQGGVV